ncbi:CRTAC1 family protein [Conexibacter arvalis]|uniref:ASPIC/UnbV domain-containing protein n=1 Tax=Conexibacter arvalis TaxID=912552 RepID=A0A840IGA5_9ACTN|nr:CRTAC1 family protein [Conexibacter arvalis]MBB4662998.1 hypothetical protein [Conexibacter arvalis]
MRCKAVLAAALAAAAMTPAAAQAARAPIALSETTTATGLWDPLLGMYGHAALAGDVNGDGWTDLVVGTFGDRPDVDYMARNSPGRAPDRLLLGGPDGFRADPSFPTFTARTTGGAIVDLDGDGDNDIVLSRNGVDRANDPFGAYSTPSMILRNDGGRFTVAQELFARRTMRHVGVLDYDGDGDLDLFFVNDRYYGRDSSVLLRNDGDLRFTDVTAAAGLPTSGLTGLAVSAADLTGDGLPDLLVSGSRRSEPASAGILESGAARIFVNRGGGSFAETDASAFHFRTLSTSDESGGIAVGDLNRDGRPDLVLGQHIAGTPASSSILAEGESIRVYLHEGLGPDGGPRYREISGEIGLGLIHTRAPHVELVDVDNDGWLDIVAATSVGDGTRPAIFRGRGVSGGLPRFENPAGLAPEERTTPPEHSGWEALGMYRYWGTGTTLDYDRDGRVDVFLAEWFPDLPSRLLRNESGARLPLLRNRWLNVEGRVPAALIGARVDVYKAGQLGRPGALIGSQPIVATTGYAGGVEPRARFGLGKRLLVDVKVTLPGGGVRAHRLVPANRTLRVR